MDIPEKQGTAKSDLVICIVAVSGLYVVAGYFDFIERWLYWTSPYEDWELDELLTAVALVSVALAWFSYRRWRESRTESEFRKVVEALRESERALARAQRQARIGSWRWAVEGNELISCSEEYARIHGVGMDEIHEHLKHQMERVIHPGDRARVEAAFERFDENNLFYDIEYRIVRPDGEVRHVLEIGDGEAVRDKSGRAIVQFGTVQDITERKRLEDQLRQSQKLDALGRLAGGIAHDFNNVLLPVIIIAEVIRDDFPPDGRQWADLDKIVRAGQRGRALVDQILMFSRQQPTTRQPIDLADVIAEALDLARSLIPPVIQVRSHLADDVGTVLADPNQIHEVMMNLMTNASQAIGSNKGVIEVSLRLASAEDAGAAATFLQAGSYACLMVSDSGAGMDEPTLANIFDPFFTTKPAGEGTGMGLATVHGIVTQHDGVITASSKPGEGATFEVCLPIAE